MTQGRHGGTWMKSLPGDWEQAICRGENQRAPGRGGWTWGYRYRVDVTDATRRVDCKSVWRLLLGHG